MKSARYAHDAITDRLKLYLTTTSIITTPNLKSLRRRYPPTQNIPKADNDTGSIIPCTRLTTDGKGDFYDEATGRKIHLKGINVDSQMKLPVEPYMPSYLGNCRDPHNIFFEGDTVSFVGRPFPLEDAPSHFQRIKSWGYNTIRYLLTWEAIEHEGPGKYDQSFADYTVQMLRIIGEIGGLYVFLEFHQDVWSRFSGGSGAPMWTFYAAGLEPKNFAETEAAILHNDPRFHDDSEIYHKMLWTSNYKRLASLVMFTLFYGGKNYFPDLMMNGENIQDYLQGKYLGSVDFMWKNICDNCGDLIDNGTILGFESMNEPNGGLIGHPRLDVLPANQQLRVGTTPTVFQTFMLGMGLTCEIDEYQISITGPRKSGTKIVDPKGVRAWVSPEIGAKLDLHYGFKRSENWVLGTCPFAEMGIWKWPPALLTTDLSELTQSQRLEITSKSILIDPDYYNKVLPQQHYEEKSHQGKIFAKIDSEVFINYHFVNHIIKFKQVIRKHAPDVFVLILTPVLEQPPDLAHDDRKIVDKKTVYCPHYYDGMSLMFKSWNSKYNVDTLGIMRGCYLNPVLGIVFGERAIRNCIRKQFAEMRRECNTYLGPIPIVMSETGMPFDMDEKRSYRNGKHISQTAALDALCNALEGAHNLSHTFWCYNSMNNHKWGDNWNNEDFSFWSPEDRNLEFDDYYEEEKVDTDPIENVTQRARKSSRTKRLKKKARNATKMGRTSSRHSSVSTTNSDSPSFYEESDTETSNSTLTSTAMGLSSSQASSIISLTSSNIKHRQLKNCYPSPDGVRAVNAVIRPYLMASRGTIVESEFDFKSRKFSLQLSVMKGAAENRFIPSVIFVPKWHFPFLDYGDIYLTSGYIKYNEELEYLEWYHAPDPSIVQEEEQEEEQEATATMKRQGSPIFTTETIVIKNNSGSLDEVKLTGGKSELGCPIT